MLTFKDLVSNGNGLSPGNFDLGLLAFVIVTILCGLGVVALFVWFLARLLQTRPIVVRTVVPVEVNDQGRDGFVRERDISYEKI
jgi:hypothetical protein